MGFVLGGIRIIQGSTVEILEIKDNAARIQVYKDAGHKFGGTDRWYDLDKFSPDLFGIDHRDPDKKPDNPISMERATELLKGKGEKRSTDASETVLEVAREAHKRLTGTDEAAN